MDWTTIGLREGILLVVALIAAYVVLMLVRLTRVGRRHSDAPPEPSAAPVPPTLWEPEIASPPPEPPARVNPPLHFEWDEVADVLGDSARHASPAPAEDPARPRSGGFGEHLAEHLARSETDLEVKRLRQEIHELRAELEELRAARRVSPQYAEAMELSQRGLTARDVAERLGISLAEAELVHALSRGEQDFDVGDEDGAERNA